MRRRHAATLSPRRRQIRTRPLAWASIHELVQEPAAIERGGPRHSRKHRGDIAAPKRILDILLAAIGLALMLPLFPLIAVGIKLSSRGAVFYRAQRIGLRGAPFVMYKFRTMHQRATADSVITATSDPRVFHFGRFLRATKLDEAPQLLNM